MSFYINSANKNFFSYRTYHRFNKVILTTFSTLNPIPFFVFLITHISYSVIAQVRPVQHDGAADRKRPRRTGI